MVRKTEEEKKKRQEEKEQRKRIREQKKRQRQQQQASNKRKKRRPLQTKSTKENLTREPKRTIEIEGEQSCSPDPREPIQPKKQAAFTYEPCAECGHYWIDGEQWLECRSCLLCHHTTCVADEEDLDNDNFVCPACQQQLVKHLFQRNFLSPAWLCDLFRLLLVYSCKIRRLRSGPNYPMAVPITPICSNVFVSWWKTS